MSMTLSDSATVSVRDAARVLGVCEKTAYRAAARGDLPVVRVGGRILVPTHRLVALLDGTPTQPAVERKRLLRERIDRLNEERPAPDEEARPEEQSDDP